MVLGALKTNGQHYHYHHHHHHCIIELCTSNHLQSKPYLQVPAKLEVLHVHHNEVVSCAVRFVSLHFNTKVYVSRQNPIFSEFKQGWNKTHGQEKEKSRV